MSKSPKRHANANIIAALLRVVLYLRRSDKKQDASIEDQRKACIAYANKHQYVIVGEFIDDGISGDDTKKRSDFQRMREQVDSGAFDAVLCWDQDRFGRFDSLEAGHWIYPFREAGVRLITINDGIIDWDDFTGRTIYALKQEAKHQLLRDLSRNVLRGQVEAAKAGSWIGSVPYGYILVGKRKQKRLKLDVATKTQVVNRIFHEFVNEQRSMNSIAVRLTADGIPSSGGNPKWRSCAVKVILENPAYAGTFRYNSHSYAKYHTFRNGEITKGGNRGPNPECDWIVIEDHHPKIVDKRTFERARQRLSQGRGKRNNYTPENNPYLFTGLLRCSKCNGNMHGDKTHPKGRRFYECGRRDDDVSACEGTKVFEDELLAYLMQYIDERYGKKLLYRFAGIKSGQRERLERVPPKVMSTLKELLLRPETVKTNPKRQRKQLAKLISQIASARRNLAHIKNPRNIAAAEAEIDAMEATCEELRAEVRAEPAAIELEQVAGSLLRQLGLFQSGDRNKIKEALRQVGHITIYSVRHGKKGNGIRFHFRRAKMHFVAVGLANSKSNPHPAG